MPRNKDPQKVKAKLKEAFDEFIAFVDEEIQIRRAQGDNEGAEHIRKQAEAFRSIIPKL